MRGLHPPGLVHDEGGHHCGLKGERAYYLEHAGAQKRRSNLPRLAALSRDVVRGGEGKPHRPDQDANARSHNEQRQIAAVFGAEAPGDEHPAR